MLKIQVLAEVHRLAAARLAALVDEGDRTSDLAIHRRIESDMGPACDEEEAALLALMAAEPRTIDDHLRKMAAMQHHIKANGENGGMFEGATVVAMLALLRDAELLQNGDNTWRLCAKQSGS